MNTTTSYPPRGDVEALTQALAHFLAGQVDEGRDALRSVSRPTLELTYTAGIRLGIEAAELVKTKAGSIPA